MKGRITAILVAAALIILGAAIAVVSLSQVGWDFSRQSTVKMREMTHLMETPFQSIEVDVTTADIHVFRSPDDTCRVHTYEQELLPIRVAVENGCLQIRQEDTREWYDHIGIFTQNSKVEIALPEAVYEILRLELTTGDVLISEDLQFRSVTVDLTTGDVDSKAQVTELLGVHATTGDVRVAAGTSEADLIIRLTTGDITVQDTVCRSMTLKATTGDMQLELCDAGTIQAQSTTGDFSAMLLSPKEFRASTTTGDVRVPDDGPGGVCDVQTTTGDITIYIQ